MIYLRLKQKQKTMNKLPIPQKSRIEWRNMVSGTINHQFKNYVLQVQINEAQKKIANKQITVDKAVDDIYVLCEKYALAVQVDFKAIFKTW